VLIELVTLPPNAAVKVTSAEQLYRQRLLKLSLIKERPETPAAIPDHHRGAAAVVPYYLDSRALVKFYRTAWVTALSALGAGHTINIVRIAGAAIIAALLRRVQIGSLLLPNNQYAVACAQ
jgi:hypothetical protein